MLLPSVSGVRLSPASPELILDHDLSSPSSGHLRSDAVISSPDDTRADSGLVSQTIPKAQVSAGLSEGKPVYRNLETASYLNSVLRCWHFCHKVDALLWQTALCGHYNRLSFAYDILDLKGE